MDRQRSIREEPNPLHGPVSRALCIGRGAGCFEKKPAFTRVFLSLAARHYRLQITNGERFMTEHIMPLSQAVEAYELFNAMKVQKVIFEADK